MSELVRSLAAELRHEIEPIQGSRFLATAAPVADVPAAQAFVARIRAEFAKATHNCWAWRVGPEGEEHRSSDDGEPAGSAGRPILMQIEGHGLTNVAVVVTRWFGGTKLGVGGLMRAYGGAAGQTLDRARIVERLRTRRVELTHPYECSGAVQGLLAAHRLEPVEAEYGAEVRLALELPPSAIEAFACELADRTAGRARLL